MDKVSVLKNIGVVLLLIASSLYYFLQTGAIELNNKKNPPKSITDKTTKTIKNSKTDKVSSETSKDKNSEIKEENTKKSNE